MAEGDGRTRRWFAPRPEPWGLSAAAVAVLAIGLLVRVIFVLAHPVAPIADFKDY